MIAEELKVVIRAETAAAVREMNQVQNTSKRTAGELTKLVAGWASVGAAVALFVREASASLKAFAELEEAQNRVAAAVEVTGENVERVLPQYQRLATDIQSMTVVSDGATFQMIALAQSMGVTSRDMEGVIQGAVGLSRAFGMNANTAIRAVTNAMEGNFSQLERYIPAVRAAGTETEKMAALQEAMGQSFEIAKRETDTLAGSYAQFQNALSDLREQTGGFLAGPARGLITWATDIVSNMAEARGQLNTLMEVLRIAGTGEVLTTVNQLEEAQTRLDALRTQLAAGIVDLGQMGRARMSASAREAYEEEAQALEELIARSKEYQSVRDAEFDRAEAQRTAEQEAAAETLRLQGINNEAIERGAEIERDAMLSAMTAQERKLFLLQEEYDAAVALRTEIRQQHEGWMGLQPVINALHGEIKNVTEAIEEMERAEALDRLAEGTRELRDEVLAGISARQQAAQAEQDAHTERMQALADEIYAEREKNQAIRADFDRMTEDQLTAIRRRRDEFIAAGVDEVKANKWATDEIAKAYAEKMQEAMNWFSQLGMSAMGVMQEISRMQQQTMNDELTTMRKIRREMDKDHRAQLEQIRIEQRAMRGQHDLELAFAEAAGASDQELAQIRLEHVRQRIEAEEHAAQREIELEAEKEAADEAMREREKVLRKEAFEQEKQMRIAQAVMAGAQAVISALSTPPFPLGLALAGVAAGMTAVQVAMIKSQQAPAFERGGSFVTNGPQMIQVGDGQSPRERVTVEPLNGPYRSGGGGGVTVNINGVVGSDRETVAEWVAEGIRRGQERGRIGKIA